MQALPPVHAAPQPPQARTLVDVLVPQVPASWQLAKGGSQDATAQVPPTHVATPGPASHATSQAAPQWRGSLPSETSQPSAVSPSQSARPRIASADRASSSPRSEPAPPSLSSAHETSHAPHVSSLPGSTHAPAQQSEPSAHRWSSSHPGTHALPTQSDPGGQSALARHCTHVCASTSQRDDAGVGCHGAAVVGRAPRDAKAAGLIAVLVRRASALSTRGAAPTVRLARGRRWGAVRGGAAGSRLAGSRRIDGRRPQHRGRSFLQFSCRAWQPPGVTRQTRQTRQTGRAPAPSEEARASERARGVTRALRHRRDHAGRHDAPVASLAQRSVAAFMGPRAWIAPSLLIARPPPRSPPSSSS